MDDAASHTRQRLSGARYAAFCLPCFAVQYASYLNADPATSRAETWVTAHVFPVIGAV